MHLVALTVFCICFAAVTIAGFMAARWHRSDLNSLEEWGLAGRRFGGVITWFLIGGDCYTAYTVIAVPGALFGIGAPGFFAIPYCIMTFPFMMFVMPRIWRVCHRHGYVTLADFVRGRYDSRPLAIAIALTGILATMPYIALQLVGMREVIAALGVHGEWPLIAAFVILAAYTYSSGLRAPAAIAIVKDVMLYIMVIAAVIVIPARLGGYGHIFAIASLSLAQHKPPASILLKPQQYLSFSTLAFGSALALVLYPHTATAALSSGSSQIIRRNAAVIPAYNLLLGLIALLGFMAIAAGIHTTNPSSAVPLLFMSQFPEWFAGFCLAAIGIGALVPAAIMSIATANLFTRNLYGEVRRKKLTPAQESAVAKVVSVFIKLGALLFVIVLKSDYAIELQLLGGVWILQIFPAVILGLYSRWLDSRALLAGWAVGLTTGTAMVASTGLKSSVYPLAIAGHAFPMYAALPALLLNLVVSIIISVALHSRGIADKRDHTASADYEVERLIDRSGIVA